MFLKGDTSSAIVVQKAGDSTAECMIRTEEACGWNAMAVASRCGPQWFFPTVTHPRVIPRLHHLQARGSFIYVQSSQAYSSWYCSNSIVSTIHRLTLTSIPDERSTSRRRNNPDTLLQQPQHQPCIPTHFKVAFDGNGLDDICTQTHDEMPCPHDDIADSEATKPFRQRQTRLQDQSSHPKQTASPTFNPSSQR